MITQAANDIIVTALEPNTPEAKSLLKIISAINSVLCVSHSGSHADNSEYFSHDAL
jgi:hypothetical protein